MTDRELMQQALDVIEAAIKAGDWQVDGACDPDYVLEALRARLAQPERKWQGLTDEEQAQVAWSCGAMSADWLEFAQAIEAKLKEKNSASN
jgi:hypothetical protein